MGCAGQQEEKPISTHFVLLKTKCPDPNSALGRCCSCLAEDLGFRAERERLGSSWDRVGVWEGAAGAAYGKWESGLSCRRSSPQDVEIDGFALNSGWAITGEKKLIQTERNELCGQQCSPVSSAFFLLIKNYAVLVWQLSLEHCINSQTCFNGFES